MEYVRHRFSGRVYEVMRDHHPDKPYLRAFPFVREISQLRLKKFFISCGKPTSDTLGRITIDEEIQWENRRIRRDEPIRVRPPEPINRPTKRKAKAAISDVGEYTLKDMCLEIGITPAAARRALRSNKVSPPEGGWSWPNRESAASVKKILEKLS